MYLLNQAKSILDIVTLVIFLPLFAPLMFIYKWLVIAIVRLFLPEYGKIFGNADFMMEEDLAKMGRGALPQATLLCSLELDGDLSLKELRSLFRSNVLNAGCASGYNSSATTARYPELMQYPSPVMGYTFWRDVEEFKLEEHVVEEEVKSYMKKCKGSLSQLHEDWINRLYLPKRSPWNITLIRCYQDHDDMASTGSGPRSIIIARFHHSMADAKSIMKLFVECLGQQPLKTAQPKPDPDQSRLKFLLTFPFIFTQHIFKNLKLTGQHWNHNWKNKLEWEGKKKVAQIVRLSEKLSLSDLKTIGRVFKASTSSVLLAVMCGAVRRVEPEVGRIFVRYILPKSNHPDYLTNHASAGTLVIPVDEDCPVRRLQNCDQIFKELRSSHADKYLDFSIALLGTEFSPIRQRHVKAMLSLCPLNITNIAGEQRGFSIGGKACSEFVISVGTLRCSTGVVFCASSYKEHCRIAVISCGGVLATSQVERICDGMKNEMEILKQL